MDVSSLRRVRHNDSPGGLVPDRGQRQIIPAESQGAPRLESHKPFVGALGNNLNQPP